MCIAFPACAEESIPDTGKPKESEAAPPQEQAEESEPAAGTPEQPDAVVEDPGQVSPDYREVTYTYTESGAVDNPGRGWYRIAKTEEAKLSTFTSWAGQGIRLCLLEADLGACKSGDIPAEKLEEISAAFDSARAAGLSVIFRAAYDFDGAAAPEPELPTVLRHIAQLGPVWTGNEDLLLCVQAGFLGPWGEWHSSAFGDPIPLEVIVTVTNALLDAVPASVSVSLRRPVYIRAVTGDNPVTREQAFGSEAVARLSFHDDAILASESDMGTWSDPAWNRQRELDWVNLQTRYTPLTAEANQLSEYTAADAAVPTLDKMNLTALNDQYHQDVMNDWRNTSYGGTTAFDYIGQRLGYRFVLHKAVISRETGTATVTLTMENTGFGNLMKAMSLEILLTTGSGETVVLKTAEDARYWDDEAGVFTVSLTFPVPQSGGPIKVSLRLCSAFGSLAGDSRYSVRFASAGMWDEVLGANRIGQLP